MWLSGSDASFCQRPLGYAFAGPAKQHKLLKIY